MGARSGSLVGPQLQRHAPAGVGVHVTRVRMTGKWHKALTELRRENAEAAAVLSNAHPYIQATLWACLEKLGSGQPIAGLGGFATLPERSLVFRPGQPPALRARNLSFKPVNLRSTLTLRMAMATAFRLPTKATSSFARVTAV